MSPLFPKELLEKVSQAGIVAVLIVDDVRHAVPLARALLQGGVCAIELTLRTASALDSLRAIRAEVPGMLVGAGTVLSPEQVAEVASAGAAFAVSPGVNPRVLEAACAAQIPFAPGIATPTDIECALSFGANVLKFFPAEPSGGLAYLRAIAAPYAHLGIRYIPLGGLNENNLATYAGEPLIAAIGGSWLAPKPLLAAGDWAAITALASRAVEVVRAARSASGR